jgi:hypothetical protein
MEITTLDNVAIGMMLVLAFLGIIFVVWNCAKIEKRVIRLEEEQEQLRNEFNTRLLGVAYFENPSAIREWTDEEKESIQKVLNWNVRKGR